MHKFTIDRSKWARGRYDNVEKGMTGKKVAEWNRLENEDGTKCCLGFLAESLGVSGGYRRTHCYFVFTSCDAKNEPLPNALAVTPSDHFYREHHLTRMHHDDDYARVLAGVNDERYRTESAREQKLTELFAKLGFEVEFVGESKSVGKTGINVEELEERVLKP